MKYHNIAAVVAGIFVSTAYATPSFFSQTPIMAGNPDLKVPGENPLEFCDEKAKSDSILKIEYVDLAPNPPLPGQTLEIKAAGNFSKEVSEGSTVSILVRYGLITLIKQNLTLCEELEKIDHKCPLNDRQIITQSVDLPKQIPPGRYSVEAVVLDANQEEVTCLKADITFSIGGVFEL